MKYEEFMAQMQKARSESAGPDPEVQVYVHSIDAEKDVITGQQPHEISNITTDDYVPGGLIFIEMIDEE